MSRFAAAFEIAVAACLVLALGLAPGPSFADIDRAFTQFEAPDTSLVLATCKNDDVLRRMRDLDAAVERLRLKIGRIEKAKAETLDAAIAARDPARRQALLNDYDALNHWSAEWTKYKEKLERQIAYYNALPPCGGKRDRRPIEWPGEVRPPVSIGPFTPVETAGQCVTREGESRIDQAASDARAQAESVKGMRKSVDNDLRELDDLNARGQGDSPRAKALKQRIQAQLDSIRRAEDLISDWNKRIKELQERFRCPPADPQHGSLRLGACEAGVLAQVNAARADPPAYGASLRSARGRFAAEARDFLSRQPPVAALAIEPRLMAAARAHADDLSSRDTVSHRGASGQGLLDRFRAHGMYVTLSAEVIAVRQDTPAGAVRALVIDEGHPGGPHRKDLFNGLFTMTGIACVRTRSHGQLVIIDLSNAPMT